MRVEKETSAVVHEETVLTVESIVESPGEPAAVVALLRAAADHVEREGCYVEAVALRQKPDSTELALYWWV